MTVSRAKRDQQAWKGKGGKFYLAVWLLMNGRVERLDVFGCKKQEPQVEHLRLLLGWLFVSWVNPRRLFRLK